MPPGPRDLPRPVSTAGQTATTSESYTTVLRANTTRSSGGSAWGNSSMSSTLVSASTNTPSPLLPPSSGSTSVTQEETSPAITTASTTSTSSASSPTTPPTSQPMPSPRATVGEDVVVTSATPLSPLVQVTTPPAMEEQHHDLPVDINSDFPPLTANSAMPTTTSAATVSTTPHSRSQSDPLVTHSLSAKILPATTGAPPTSPSPCVSQTSEVGGVSGSLTIEAQPPRAISVTSSWPLPSAAAHAKLPQDQKEAAPTSYQLPSEKLPFVPEPKSPPPDVLEEAGGGSGRGSLGGRGSGGDVSSLAVGSRPAKAVKGVAGVQTSQQV